MRHRELPGAKCILGLVDKPQELQTPADVGGRARHFERDGFKRVARRIEALQGGVTLRFVEFMHVLAQQVFDELQLRCLGVAQLADGRGNRFAPCQFRGAKAARPDHQFVRFA
jgi:hypothetical protein